MKKCGITFLIWFLFQGCTPTAIQPLPDPVFRLSTSLKATGCDPSKDQLPCNWVIDGDSQSATVVNPGDNPFQDCANCSFTQKFGILDGLGAIHYVYYQIPRVNAIPVPVSTQQQKYKVKLSYVKADRSGQGFAMSLVDDQGNLYAAIASGAGGEFLKNLLGEFTVTVDQEKEAGREKSDCGTRVFRFMNFQSKATGVSLPPGKTAEVADSRGVNYIVGNVNRYNWEGSRCTNLGPTPFSFFIVRKQ